MLPQIWCIFRDGRYEGFKSSGKIELIENDSLKTDILTYYQSSIPEIHRAEEEFKNSRSQITNLILTQSENESFGDLITSKKAKVIYKLSGEHLYWMINNNQFAHERAKQIKKEIEKEIAE